MIGSVDSPHMKILQPIGLLIFSDKIDEIDGVGGISGTLPRIKLQI
jgi:hypothetical protein